MKNYFKVLAAVFLLTFAFGVRAETFNDLAGKTLQEGSWITPDSAYIFGGADRFIQKEINAAMFQKAELGISRSGEVSGGADLSFSDIKWLNTDLIYKGSAKLVFEGTYDSKENTISGSYDITQTATLASDPAVSKLTWKSKGSLKGNRTDDGGMLLTLKGNEDVTILASGATNNSSRDFSHQAKFNDFAGVSVTDEGSEEEEGEGAIPKYDDLTLDRVLGDAQYSDPKQKASFAESTARSLKAIVPPWNAPYGGVFRKWEKPEKSIEVKDDFLIKTDRGMAVFTFTDGTKFILGRGSEMRKTPNGIRLDKGTGYYIFPKSGKRINVEAPQGRVGVKGTEFSVETDGKTSAVKLVEGSVEISSDNTDELVTLTAGQSVNMIKEGLGEPESFDEKAEKDKWTKLEAEAPDSVTSDTSEAVLLPIVLGLFALGVIVFIVIMTVIKMKKVGKKDMKAGVGQSGENEIMKKDNDSVEDTTSEETKN